MNTVAHCSPLLLHIYIIPCFCIHIFVCVCFFSDVVYQLPTVKVFASSDEEDKASFSCFATDFSPNSYKIKWLKNGHDFNNQTDKIETTSVERKNKNGTKVYSTASFLKVKSSDWSHGTEFTCLFEGKGEKDIPAYKNSSVVYKDCGE